MGDVIRSTEVRGGMGSTPLCGAAVCQDAADHAVKKVFAILGVDVDKPESVEAFREDLRFGRRLRKIADRGWFAMITVVTTLAVTSAVAAIMSNLRGSP